MFPFHTCNTHRHDKKALVALLLAVQLVWQRQVTVFRSSFKKFGFHKVAPTNPVLTSASTTTLSGRKRTATLLQVELLSLCLSSAIFFTSIILWKGLFLLQRHVGDFKAKTNPNIFFFQNKYRMIQPYFHLPHPSSNPFIHEGEDNCISLSESLSFRRDES
jgi:hypothetical protein